MPGILLIPAPFVDEGRLVPYVPYGLLSLQAVAEELGEDVGILAFSGISGDVYESSDELASAIADLVDGSNCQAVGLSAMCSSFHHTLGVAVELRRRYPKLEIWLGGPHASVDPTLLLERFAEIDAVFVGEGEALFEHVIRHWQVQPGAPFPDLPGSCTRYSRLLPRQLITDLDTLPFVDQAPDFTSSLAASEDTSARGVPLEAERGCPGRCTFCSTRLYWGNRARYKSANRIITEMHRLHAATGDNLFSLIGDNMAASPKRLLAFCECMAKEAPSYRWDCSLTLDRLCTEDLTVLWAGGCRRMFVGLESGSQNTLDRIRKDIDLTRSIDLLGEALKRGFSIHTSFIVGFPWETSSDLRATYDLHAALLERGVDHSHVDLLCPLPGSDLDRSHREMIQPGRGYSKTAIDFLPHGDRTLGILERCPELFRQFGRFETTNVDPVEVRTLVRAASLLGAYHERQQNELPADVDAVRD